MALSEVHTVFDFRFNAGRLSAIERGTKRSASHLATTAKKAELFQSRVVGGLRRAGQALVAFGAYRALRFFTSDFAQAADENAKFADGLGISTEAYQKLTFAAGLAGVTQSELNTALPKFAKSAADAADGSKAMADAFDRAGLKLRGGKFLGDPIKMMTAFADGLKKVKDPIRRAQILQNAFGRSGKKMGVLMSGGAEGIKKAMREAEKYGFVLSRKQQKIAENYNDEMLRTKMVFTGLRNQLALKLLPAINKLLRGFTAWVREGNNLEKLTRRLKTGAIFAGIAIGAMITTSVLRKVSGFVKGVWAGVHAVRALNMASAAAAAKVALLFAGFALVYLIIEDLVYFAQGKDSLIGRLLGDSQLAKDLKESLLDLAKAVTDAWDEIGPKLEKVWTEDLEPALDDLWEAIEPLIGPAFSAGVWLMIAGFKGLAVAIRVVSKLLEIQMATWKGYKIAAGYVVKAIKFIRDMLLDTAHVANVAAAAIAAVTGKGKAGTAIDIGAKAANKAGKGITKGSVIASTPLPAGTMRPAHLLPPSQATYGRPLLAAGGGTTVTTHVAPGAIPLNVYASGDPRQIAEAVNDRLDKGIKKAFTKASRDLKKPPAGQR